MGPGRHVLFISDRWGRILTFAIPMVVMRIWLELENAANERSAA